MADATGKKRARPRTLHVEGKYGEYVALLRARPSGKGDGTKARIGDKELVTGAKELLRAIRSKRAPVPQNMSKLIRGKK